MITAVAVLLIWIPLRRRPGVGTGANVFMIGAIVLNGVATACYIGARLGPGPRDGLMTGLVARTGGSIWLVRTLLEIAVVATGWLLGGNFGLGTLLYVVSIGPLAQLFLPPADLRGQGHREEVTTGATG